MRPRSCHSLATASFLALLAGAPVALADIPPVLDRVPADAPVVITIRNLEDFAAKVRKVTDLLKLEDAQDGLVMIDAALHMDGINSKGSAALIALIPKPGEEKPHDAHNDAGKKDAPKNDDAKPADDMNPDDAGMDHNDDMDAHPDTPGLVLLPITDFKAFVTAANGKPGEKVAQVHIGDDDAYARDAGGGFAVLSNDKHLVETFEIKPGQRPSHEKLMGGTGGRIANNADAFLIANVQVLRPQIEQGSKKVRTQLRQMAMMPGGEQLAAGSAFIEAATEAFSRDATASVVGLGLGDKGVTLDAAAQFREGSPAAAYFQSKGDTSALMARVPSKDFLFAFAVDTRAQGIKNLVKEIKSLSEKSAKKPDAGAPNDFMSNITLDIDNVNGQAMVMGATPDLGAGLFVNTSTYVAAKDPASHLAKMKESMLKTDGKEQNGVKFAVEFKPAEKEIAGAKLDAWSVGMQTDPNNPAAMQMQMVSGFLFGQEGKLAGYTAPVGQGAVTTFSRNEKNVAGALEAAQSGKGLADNESLRQTSALLAPDRSFEGYLGTKSIIDLVGQFVAQFGGGPEIVAPEKVSAIGVSGNTNDGGVSFRLALPNDVLAAFAKMKSDMDEGRQGMGEHQGKPQQRKSPKF